MVEQLTSLYRDAVRLVDLEGLPQQEAAARSGITVSGMKSRVQRGRQALKYLVHGCCQIDLDAGGRATDYQPRGHGCGPCAQECERKIERFGIRRIAGSRTAVERDQDTCETRIVK